MNPKINQRLEAIEKQEVIPLIERTVTAYLDGRLPREKYLEVLHQEFARVNNKKSDKCDICGGDLTQTSAGEVVCNAFIEQPNIIKAEIGTFVKSDHIETFYHEHDEVRGEFKGDKD
jgi:hypothetical protein